MHDQLAARSLHRIGRVQVGVAGEFSRAVQQEAPGQRVAAVPQVQHHMLGQRADAILVGGAADELERSGDVVARQVADDSHLAHSGSLSRSPMAIFSVRPGGWRPGRTFPLPAPWAVGGILRLSGLAGTNLYPTLRTVPISASFSDPSLARSLRTCTSTVLVPPKYSYPQTSARSCDLVNTRLGCCARNFSSSNSLKVRSSATPLILAEYVASSITSSPERTSAEAWSTGGPRSTRPIASLILASTSPGPAV